MEIKKKEFLTKRAGISFTESNYAWLMKQKLEKKRTLSEIINAIIEYIRDKES